MKILRNYGFAVLAVLLTMVMAVGCSSDSSSEAESLLKTVPADVDAVAMLNVEQLLKKGGCKVNGTEIELPADLRKKIEQMKDTAARNTIMTIAGGEAGVSPKAICIFYGTRTFITGLLEDPSAFKSYVEKRMESPFVEDGGANVNRNIAFIGNQFWIGIPGLPESAELVRYTKLSKDQSMAGHPYAEKLTSMKEDMEGMADLGQVLGISGRSRAQISMAMAALFDKATMIGFKGNVGKTNVEISARFLNSKGEPAKYLLPTGKIDTKLIEKTGAKTESLVAADVPSGLVKKITGMFALFGGGLPESLTAPLEEIEGTLVLSGGPDGMTGIVSTAKAPSPALVELAGEQSRMTVTVDGKSMLLNKGKVPGGRIEVSSVAGCFKGAMFGAVGEHLVGICDYYPGYYEGLMVSPVDNTLEIKMFAELGPDGWQKLLVKAL